MSLTFLVLGVLTSLGVGPQPGAALEPGHLRWVRGVVAAASPTSVTLTLRGDDSLTLRLDPSAGMPALAEGARVDAHYTDRTGERRAVLILDSNWLEGTLSSSPGRSYRGTVDRLRGSTLRLNVETRPRNVHIDARTVLFGVDGRALASGRREIVAALANGDPLLVIFDEVVDDVLTNRRAREIRKLR